MELNLSSGAAVTSCDRGQFCLSEFGNKMTSSASSVGYSNLVESIHKGRYLQICAQGAVDGSTLPMHRTLMQRDWAVPSYDITGLFAGIPTDDLNKCRQLVQAYSQRASLLMPHDSFALVMHDFGRTVVLYVSKKIDTFFDISSIEDSLQILKELGRYSFIADSWVYAPQSVNSSYNWYRSQIALCDNRLIRVASSALNKEDYVTSAQVQMTKLFWFLAMMEVQSAESNKIFKFQDPTSSYSAMMIDDIGAVKNTDMKTHSVLLLSFNPVEEFMRKSEVVTKGASTPKRGHIRRGHYHTYSGERRWIEEIKVKGGYDTIPETKIVRRKK